MSSTSRYQPPSIAGDCVWLLEDLLQLGHHKVNVVCLKRWYIRVLQLLNLSTTHPKA